MPCSRCGRNVYPLFSMPTMVSKVTRQIKDLEWVCEDCLTPKEKLMRNLRQLKKSEKEWMLDEEFGFWMAKVSGFNCPFHRDPFDCDRFDCPRFDECLEFLKANMTVDKVLRGKIKLVNSKARPGEGEWEAPL